MEPYWYKLGGERTPDEFGLSRRRGPSRSGSSPSGRSGVAAFIAEPIQGAGRGDRAAGHVLAGGRPHLPRVRGAPGRRRGNLRLRAHRPLVRLRVLRARPRPDADREGPFLGLYADRGGSWCTTGSPSLSSGGAASSSTASPGPGTPVACAVAPREHPDPPRRGDRGALPGAHRALLPGRRSRARRPPPRRRGPGRGDARCPPARRGPRRPGSASSPRARSAPRAANAASRTGS